ncbi:Pleckstrin y domain-containing A member 1 [Mortierella sp. NVP85]|nr:Pleckstrin y domain-containing A member 1 [Mortierella sp. NVP85]
MTTDDEAASSASFRQRTRKISKTGSVPSTLSGISPFSTVKNTSSNALSSSFSFLSSDNKTPATTTNTVDTNAKPTSQLRVRNLERESTYAGYLTKFSSRTFFSRKQWKRRYFILTEKALYCFKSSDPQHPLLESLALSPDAIICVTDIFAGKRYCLQISCPSEKPWYVLADTAPEMSGWLKELKSVVQRVRNTLPASRPGTLYSDEDEISEISSASIAVRIPTVPAIPVQYEYKGRESRTSRSMSGSMLLPTYQSQVKQHQQDQFPSQASLNPPPRIMTPKPSTPTPGTGPQQAQQPQAHVYGQLSSSSPSQTQLLQQTHQTQEQTERRRRNSSFSAGQSSDYASFGAVMARADAMAEEQKEQPSSTWSMPTKSERPDTNYATIPRSRRGSVMSTASTMSTAVSRASVMGQSENALPIPHRSAQRPAPAARPMSSAVARPLSPTLSRPSPRSSLVIAPPPRSIHRPTSVSIRHSTQILPPPQIVTAGLPSKPASAANTLTPTSPTSSLPGTPDSETAQNQNGLSNRIANTRHAREGSNRHTIMHVATGSTGSTGSLGSIQERTRSPSRSSIMRSALPSDSMNRPISPTPSLASAPTQPLPEPPRTGSTSPSKAGQSSLASPASIEMARRHPLVPRHHEPDLPIPNRSNARLRSQSQSQVQSPGAASITAKLGGIQISRRATTSSPGPSPMATLIKENASTTTGEKDTANSNGNSDPLVRPSLGGHRQLSLPLHTMYVFPAPPTGLAPQKPSSAGSARPLMQRSSGSSSSLRPISSVANNVPSLGGGTARRPSTGKITLGPKGELISSARLSTVIVLPPGPTTAVPPTPFSALPAPPTSALPEKPVSIEEASRQVKFGVILEEEEQLGDEDEDEDDDDDEFADATDHDIGLNTVDEEAHIGEDEEEDEDDEEFATSQLQFEDLEAAKEDAEQGLDPESTVTTPTTATRPEYYAAKQKKIVEYIFPSESLHA